MNISTALKKLQCDITFPLQKLIQWDNLPPLLSIKLPFIIAVLQSRRIRVNYKPNYPLFAFFLNMNKYFNSKLPNKKKTK